MRGQGQRIRPMGFPVSRDFGEHGLFVLWIAPGKPTPPGYTRATFSLPDAPELRLKPAKPPKVQQHQPRGSVQAKRSPEEQAKVREKRRAKRQRQTERKRRAWGKL